LQQLKQNNDKRRRARDTEGPPQRANKGYGRQYGGTSGRTPAATVIVRARHPRTDPHPGSTRATWPQWAGPVDRHFASSIGVKTIEPSPAIEQEPDKTPLKAVVRPAEETPIILTRSKTKGMAQVEVIQTDMPCATPSLLTKMVGEANQRLATWRCTGRYLQTSLY
jgi:hypothetical protein